MSQPRLPLPILLLIGNHSRLGESPSKPLAGAHKRETQFTALREIEAPFLDEAGELRGVAPNPKMILALNCSLLCVPDLTGSALGQLGTSYEEVVSESPWRFIEKCEG
jgi:hypothetical protein